MSHYLPPASSIQYFLSWTRLFLWKAIFQLYGDAEAGRYWHHMFIVRITKNFFNLRQSLLDHSFLIDARVPVSIALCTDDAFKTFSKSGTSIEQMIPDWLWSRNAQTPPTEFKGINTVGSTITRSQFSYTDALQIPDTPLNLTKTVTPAPSLMNNDPSYGPLLEVLFRLPHPHARYFRFLQVLHSKKSRNNRKQLYRHSFRHQEPAISATFQTSLNQVHSLRWIYFTHSCLCRFILPKSAY